MGHHHIQLVHVQGAVGLVNADGQGQHHSRHTDGHHDARQHQARGDGVDVVLHRGDAVHDDGNGAAGDIAAVCQQQEHAGIHNVQADDLFQQVPVKQQHAEADDEQQNGYHQLVIGSKGLQHHSSPLLKYI